MDYLLKVDETDKLFVRELYGTNEEYLKRDISILKEWLKKQPHIPQEIQDDKFFENILIKNKCRVEKAKQKIDDYYTLRGIKKELVDKFEDITPSKLSSTVLVLPTLTKAKERVIILKLIDTDPAKYNFLTSSRLLLACLELLFEYDYSAGIVGILDFQDYSFSHLKKINPVIFSEMLELINNAYSNRICRIEIINSMSVLQAFMKISKAVLPPKIYSKIHTHENFKSLHEIIPKEILPKDFEGNLPTVVEQLKKWDQIFESHREFFINNRKNVSNEQLRIEPSKYNADQFGVKGTFKKINLD